MQSSWRSYPGCWLNSDCRKQSIKSPNLAELLTRLDIRECIKWGDCRFQIRNTNIPLSTLSSSPLGRACACFTLCCCDNDDRVFMRKYPCTLIYNNALYKRRRLSGNFRDSTIIAADVAIWKRFHLHDVNQPDTGYVNLICILVKGVDLLLDSQIYIEALSISRTAWPWIDSAYLIA